MTDFNTAKDTLLASIESQEHLFATTLAFIKTWYDFTPTAFRNGDIMNSAQQNQGSAQVFALSQLLNLSRDQTLACFGEHYREALETPEVDNHRNLRRVLREGNVDITFDQFPLQATIQ